MLREPLFTVVLPTHDRPALLAAAVDSVLAQTLPDFELVVVDDGSPEPVALPDDARVRLIRLPTSRGPAAARNAGMDVATGQYLTFLDDDDLFSEDRLELGAEGLARAPVATCWTRFHDRPPGDNRRLEGNVADVILDTGTPCLGATAIRREVAPRFDERWRAVEDVDWWIRVAASTPVTTVSRIGYLVRRHQGPRHHNHVEARLEENLALIDAYAHYLARHRRSAAYRWKRVGLMALQLGDRSTARRAFMRSMRLAPRPATVEHLLRSIGRSARRDPGPPQPSESVDEPVSAH